MRFVQEILLYQIKNYTIGKVLEHLYLQIGDIHRNRRDLQSFPNLIHQIPFNKFLNFAVIKFFQTIIANQNSFYDIFILVCQELKL